MEATEYKFEIWQDGKRQAFGQGESRAFVRKEAAHYAMIYGQYGPLEVRTFCKVGGVWVRD